MSKTTIDMAREAGLLTWLKPPEDVIERFKAFADLVRADEREECAKVCEEVLEQYRGTDMGKHAELVGDNCAAAIRAIGENT